MDHGQLQGDPDPHIYIGQKVRIKVDALPGKIFNGEVTAISDATGSKYSLVPTDKFRRKLRQRYNNVSRYG